MLRRYREAAGQSQEELAARADLTKNAIGALERGERRRPYPDTIRRLAAALGLSDAAREALAAAARGGVVRPSQAPPAVPATPQPLDVPAYLEPLIGRERETATLLHMLGQPEVRLLTLTGPGGVGKTRLAGELAWAALGIFPDGVAWTSLAPLTEPALVTPAVAHALGLREAGGQTPRELLRGYLRDRHVLLVLDNFEHVLGASPDVAALLLGCPRLTVLTTSRAPLRIQGEQEYPLPPLGLPDLSHVPRLRDVERAPSVALFVRRARQASPAFDLTAANALSIAAICRRLDGLPLAIELAAARVKLLSPPEILQRLDCALPLLTGGARDLPERQRTMRDAIAWSYDLLDEGARVLLRRLSVFAGGWTLHAAEDVVAGGDVDAEQVLDLLGRLVDQSLVVADAIPGERRYRMLEPVRQYAAELLGAGEEAATVRRRHAAYYLRLAEHEEPELGRIERAAHLDMLEAEHGNLRAAMQWFEDEGDETARLRMAACLGWFWLLGGHWSEGRTRLDRALGGDGGGVQEGGVTSESMPSRTMPRARALYYAAELAYAEGDLADARSLYEGSIATLRAAGDRRSLAQALHRLGEVRWSYGEAAGIRAVNEEAAALFQEVGDAGGLAGALRGQGKAAILAGNHALARSLLTESLTLSRGAGDEWGSALALLDMARVALLGRDPVEARTAAEGSLSRFKMLGDQKGVIVSLHNLGLAMAMAGEHEQARSLHERALVLCGELGDRRFLPRSLAGLANVARAEGRAERAARLLGAVDALLEAMFPPVRPWEHAENELAVAWARAALGEERFAAVWAEGRAMEMEDVMGYALSGDGWDGST